MPASLQAPAVSADSQPFASPLFRTTKKWLLFCCSSRARPQAPVGPGPKPLWAWAPSPWTPQPKPCLRPWWPSVLGKLYIYEQFMAFSGESRTFRKNQDLRIFRFGCISAEIPLCEASCSSMEANMVQEDSE